MNINALIIMSASIIISASLIIAVKIRERKLYAGLNRLLDNAINNNLDETVFDETCISALEMKLAQYLASSQASSRKIEDERNKIKTLISDISHQTKTPISNMLLYGELLSERDLDSESRQYVNIINSQTQKLSFLINALVNLSRLETGVISVTPRENDIAMLVRRLYQQYKHIADIKGVGLYNDCNSHCVSELTAVFDERWTFEAIGNIIDNAIKYTDAGNVRLRIIPYEMFCCIEISDTGPGIDEDEQAQVFMRFYRGKNSAQKEGIGIGLYLARQIITLQGGYIKLTSPINKNDAFKGTKFQIYLPKLKIG